MQSVPGKTRPRVLIVGAGMTGLVAARELERQGIASVVVDKGRGVGGRMATRTLTCPNHGKLCMDLGAQFITARDPSFIHAVEQWCTEGAARTWCHGFANPPDSRHVVSDHPRFYGPQGMGSIADHLATGADFRPGCRIEKLELRDRRWAAVDSGANCLEGDALLLTAPLPQTLSLLDASGIDFDPQVRDELGSISYFRCIAVMAVLDGPSAIPDPGAIQFNREPIDWIADNRRKGICPGGYGVTIHAAPGFSQRHFDDDREQTADRVLEACAELLNANVVSREIRAWRYSSPMRSYSERSLRIPTVAPLVLAGDGFGGPRLEGAFLSGCAAAKQLASGLSAFT